MSKCRTKPHPNFKNLGKVDFDDQSVAAQISPIEIRLDHTPDEAIPLVEWAHTTIGHCKPAKM